jgi:protein TonB
MNYLQRQRNPLQSVPGLAAVAMLHLALIYALMVGMRAEKAPALPPPLRVHVAETITPPPPPPPAPAPTLATPRTLSVPVPDITLARVARSHPAMAWLPRSGQAPGAPAAGPPAADHQFTAAQIISGSRAPDYPAAYEDSGRPGQVTVDCVITASGVPSHCKMVSSDGGNAFATETMRWLTGPAHPVYRAAVVNGQARAEEHRWTVSFEAPQ